MEVKNDKLNTAEKFSYKKKKSVKKKREKKDNFIMVLIIFILPANLRSKCCLKNKTKENKKTNKRKYRIL